MSRSLRSFLPLEGDPGAAVAAFRGDPQRWLPDPRPLAADRWQIDVGPAAWSHPVTVTLGAPWQAGRTWWRTFCWEPSGPDVPGGVARLLPQLDAELGLTVRPSGHATLLVDGRYDPPGGWFGDAADAVALGRVATATVDRLLRELTRRLGTPVPVG